MPAFLRILALLVLFLPLDKAWAVQEDGYELWLRYRPLDSQAQARVRPHAQAIVFAGKPSLTVQAAVAELQRGIKGLLGQEPSLVQALRDGAVVLATPTSMPALDTLKLPMAALGKEGYLLRRLQWRGHSVTLIAANSDVGLLYGAFAWLRAVNTGGDLAALDVQSIPKVQLRMLNHWDNLDRTVERGYAGESIWDWWALPDISDTRYVDYARANASLGINGAALNNVNSKAEVLTGPWIAKAAALADTLRPYGIKVYLSVRFSTPWELKETVTADPLEPAVAAWWREKAREIYTAIPDFGGFLVKANSEGQPGPQDYGRNHADGANMLARALAPHGGVVLWRAFVYSPDNREDRAKQAFSEFKPLDGSFDANVVVQVKNGAIDFQPREPFHPLLGAMPKTALALELQITKEYLGFATHLAYLGPLFEEVLKTDTRWRDTGATVADVVDGSLHRHPLTAMAGVANIGSSRSWSGSHFDQANWYVFGRMAWDPRASARALAEEWVAQTFSTDPKVISAVADMMMRSREAVVNYMTPLGLHHLMATGHHHGPGPWVDDLQRPDWNPVYYHQADTGGIGFDRGPQGSNAVAQYAPGWQRVFSDPHSTPDEYLLWFHHLPWDYKMRSGNTLWVELVGHYDAGVAAASDLHLRWTHLKAAIDPQRYAETEARLRVQKREAQWWRDACLVYFQVVSGQALPPGTQAAPLSLQQYKAIRFPYAPGRG
ncbi:MAG: alpha-glucuronidase [Comamonadaceae bacterium PBBC2]|nr:MAG: alpha-glucuronidase [Comamonadaceae bacterium PBBC2]